MNQNALRATLLPLVLLAALAAVPADAAAYMKIKGLDGESQSATDDKHKDWITLDSVSSRLDLVPSALAAPGASSTGATRRRGDVVLEDITITKKADKASPSLSEAVCKGKVFPKVDVYLSASYGGSRATYLKYELTNVMVTSYSVSAGGSGGEDRPTETISLNFEAVKVTYEEQDGMASKSKGGNAETTWKVEKGEK